MTETKESLPGECSGRIRVGDELVDVEGTLVKGLALEEVVKVIRDAIRAKETGRAVCLRFKLRSNDNNKAAATGTESSLKEQTILSKQKLQSSSEPDPDAQSEGETKTGGAVSAAESSEKPSETGAPLWNSDMDTTDSKESGLKESMETSTVPTEYLNVVTTQQTRSEYDVMIVPDPQLGMGIVLDGRNDSTAVVKGFKKNRGE